MEDSHPLDWYPGDEPESRTPDEANRWVDETLKYEVGPNVRGGRR